MRKAQCVAELLGQLWIVGGDPARQFLKHLLDFRGGFLVNEQLERTGNSDPALVGSIVVDACSQLGCGVREFVKLGFARRVDKKVSDGGGVVVQHHDALAAEAHTSRAVRDQLKRERARLEAPEDQCVELIGDPDWPAAKLTERIRDLRVKKTAIDEQLQAADTTETTEARQTIETLLELLADPRSVYRSARDADRKLLNQICFAALYLTRDQHGIETARSEHPATAAPLLERIKFRRTRNGAVPEDNAAHENGFHKPMGSDHPPCARGDLNPHVR